jgi:drug/metabolite transporter (DMT)-like permease
VSHQLEVQNLISVSPQDLFALGAAFCWALTGFISSGPSKYLGSMAFTRWRMLLVALMLWPIVLVLGSWQTLQVSQLGVLALSGLIGIFVGDTALFGALNRLGPRRTSVVFATHALFSALLGSVFLGERIGLQAGLGGILVVGGVMIAVMFGKHKDDDHDWETLGGAWKTGVALALLAALCQAVGSLIAKPVMAQGVDPVAATTVRVTATCLAQFALLWSGFAAAKAQQAANAAVLRQVALSGFIGMGIGMSMVLMALKHGDVGTVGILSSVTPVLVLPVLWVLLGRAPARGAWAGSLLTVAGTVMVLAR